MGTYKCLEVGEIVNSDCADWEWDNPMEVIEASHVCHCGCGADGMVSCRGKSGKIYEEVECWWSRIE